MGPACPTIFKKKIPQDPRKAPWEKEGEGPRKQRASETKIGWELPKKKGGGEAISP